MTNWVPRRNDSSVPVVPVCRFGIEYRRIETKRTLVDAHISLLVLVDIKLQDSLEDVIDKILLGFLDARVL